MFLNQTKATFDQAAAAAGCTVAPAAGADLASQTPVGAPNTVQVQALTMKGLRFLVWTCGYDVPASDCLILLTNIQAEATGNGTAWVQT